MIARCDRLGRLSWGSSSGAAVGTSGGVSQYGLALAKDRSGIPLDDCRSEIAPVTDIFSSAPTCSCDARNARRILRPNQTTAAKKAPSMKRFPSAYQLLCIQADISFMVSPWTGTARIYSSAPAVVTGAKSRKRAGVALPPRSTGPNCVPLGPARSEAPPLAHQFPHFLSLADRVSLNTPTHSFRPQLLAVVLLKSCVFCYLEVARRTAARLHPICLGRQIALAIAQRPRPVI